MGDTLMTVNTGLAIAMSLLIIWISTLYSLIMTIGTALFLTIKVHIVKTMTVSALS